MIKNVKISSAQLFFLAAAFIWGNSSIVSTASLAGRDAWLAFILGWIGGFLLLGLYVYIARLHPNKTLCEISQAIFGKFLGTLISILYIWYFIHVASIVFRSLAGYINVVTYVEVPQTFILIFFSLVIVYMLKKGLEVAGRVSELVVWGKFAFSLGITALVLNKIDFSNLQPFLEKGFFPVLKAAFGVAALPFGETVVFLMIFPFLNDQKKIFKTAFGAAFTSGLLLFIILFRNILVLGSDMTERTVFPAHLITTLVPGAVVDPFLAVNLIMIGTFQIVIFLYAALIILTRLLNLKDYKPFVFPMVALCISITSWLYNNLSHALQMDIYIYPYYAIPFQIIIPVMIFIISLIKNKINSIKG